MIERYKVEYELDGEKRELIIPARDRDQAKKIVEAHATTRIGYDKCRPEVRILRVRKLA